VAVDSVEATTSPFPTLPEQVFVRRAFRDLQWGDEAGAVSRLDSACVVLLDLMDPESGAVDVVRLLSGTRVIIELFHGLVPKAAAIEPTSGLGRLMGALPDPVRADLTDHPYYRELYLRTLAGMADVPVDLTPEVRQSLEFFTTTARDVFEVWLDRSADFQALIDVELQAAELPSDLIYLAMIESGFNPKAYSVAHAAGIWQFTHHTGVLYGLRRNTWVDERRDPEKATRAAVRHLSHLYDLFGDWRLVVAAYNCGQGRLGRVIRKSGTTEYWDLEGLPRETRGHVPRFMAAALISKDPGWFGFEEPQAGVVFKHETVAVKECVDLRVAAECAGTSYERMRQLNPELRKGYTPPVKGQTYTLRVPPGTGSRFLDRYAHLPLEQRVRMVDYRVRPGDTVSQIARRMGVSSRVVMDANQIRDARRLRAGAMLQIPLHPDLLARYVPSASREAQPDPFSSVRSTYRIRRGDTLWEIARREGVTTEKIRRWNNLRSSQYIYPGDRLTIWKASKELGAGGVAMASHEGGYYKVRRGDTLWDIARTFQTSVGDLKRWNGIRNPSQIRANTKLRVMPPEGLVD